MHKQEGSFATIVRQKSDFQVPEDAKFIVRIPRVPPPQGPPEPLWPKLLRLSKYSNPEWRQSKAFKCWGSLVCHPYRLPKAPEKPSDVSHPPEEEKPQTPHVELNYPNSLSSPGINWDTELNFTDTVTVMMKK